MEFRMTATRWSHWGPVTSRSLSPAGQTSTEPALSKASASRRWGVRCSPRVEFGGDVSGGIDDDGGHGDGGLVAGFVGDLGFDVDGGGVVAGVDVGGEDVGAGGFEAVVEWECLVDIAGGVEPDAGVDAAVVG